MSDRPVVRKSLSSPVILAVLTAVVGPTTHAQAQTPRHDLVAQCPRLANELPELLAGAKQEIRREAQLRVSLQIDTGGRLRIETIDGDRRYASAVRRALVGLRCADELPEAQRQVLTIRFEDPLGNDTLPLRLAVKRSFHPNLGTLQGPAIGLALLFLLAATPWLALIWLATWLLHRWLPEAPSAARRTGLALEVLGVVVLVFAAWFALAAVLNQPFRIGPYLLQLVLLQTLCVVGAYEYLLRTRKARRESHALQLSERLLAREVDAAHLQLLQAQVEPHFLFNTLAHLRRLASTDVAEARAMLGELLQVLAEALPSMREAQTPLSRELQLVRAYLGLHQRRMGESRLHQRFEVAPGLDAALLPSTTLLTLVENAVKHGLAPLVEGGEIAVRAEAREGRLLLEVADTGRGMGAGGGHGTGLANLRARLKALHGDAAELSLHLNEPRGLVARVCLPLT